MKNNIIVFYLGSVTAFIGLIFLSIKYYLIHSYRSNRSKSLHYPLLWYSSDDVLGTASEQRRKIMEKANIFTTIAVACFVLTAIIIILPYFIFEEE